MQRFLSRIMAQKFQNLGTAALVMPPTQRQANIVKSDEEEVVEKEPDEEEPLSSSEIAFYLNKFDKDMESSDSLIFDSIQTAASWYESNRTSFAAHLLPIMDTLVTARNQVNMGCSCKKHVRQRMADDYLKTFIIGNQKTDVIPSIKLAAKVQTIIVKIADEIFFQG